MLAFLVALASVSVQLTPNTWIFRDGRFYVNVATTIVEDLSLEQHRFAASWYSGTLGWNHDLDPGWSNVALGRSGQYWPKHPYLLPLFASPLLFAFGLPATLLFNLLMFGVIVGGLFRFASAYGDPESAALASVLFVFATIVVGSAYDFSTDVLMLALFSQGLAAVKERHGAWAGVAVGLCVMIKPTALMLLPSLVLLFFERTSPREAAPVWGTTRRELGRAFAGGTLVLMLFALANTWMYGRPWWSGYNRTLITSGGAPALASHTDAFSVPFEQGLRRVLFGDYGLVAGFGVLAVAVPGLFVLARRRPRAFVAAIVGVLASLGVFSLYVYEGHRFHWPALALLVPAVATSLAWVGGTLRPRALIERARHASARHVLLVAVGAFAATMATVQGGGRARLGASPWADAALEALDGLVLPEVAPFLVIALHALAAAVLCVSVASLVEGPRALRAAAAIAPFGLGEVRHGLHEGGPALFAVAFLVAALALVVKRARLVGERAALAPGRTTFAAAMLVGLALACAALPHDDGVALLPTLVESLASRNEARALWPFVVPAILGVVVLATGAHRRRSAPGALALSTLAVLALEVPSWLGASPRTAVALAVIALSAIAVPTVAVLVRAVGDGDFDGRRLARWALSVIALCLAIGGVRRVMARQEPFRLASEEAVRTAMVFLATPGFGDVPCDFLAWEHLSWECATFDQGTHGETGLAVDDPAVIAGTPRTLFFVPSGLRGERRRVVWPEARAGRELVLRWAVPDRHTGGGELVVRVDDREVARETLPFEPTGRLRELRIPTPDAGSTARLEVEVAGLRRQSVVVMDGEWR
ncbi:MAG: hypothetical protein OHK0013_48010 [Sandaracinaceae bacterium]